MVSFTHQLYVSRIRKCYIPMNDFRHNDSKETLKREQKDTPVFAKHMQRKQSENA
jgi:hypothetical protein